MWRYPGSGDRKAKGIGCAGHGGGTEAAASEGRGGGTCLTSFVPRVCCCQERAWPVPARVVVVPLVGMAGEKTSIKTADGPYCSLSPLLTDPSAD